MHILKKPHYSVAGNDVYVGEVVVSAIVLAVIGLMFIIAKPLLRKLMTILSVVLLTGILIIAVTCLPHAIRSGNISDIDNLNGIKSVPTFFAASRF